MCRSHDCLTIIHYRGHYVMLRWLGKCSFIRLAVYSMCDCICCNDHTHRLKYDQRANLKCMKQKFIKIQTKSFSQLNPALASLCSSAFTFECNAHILKSNQEHSPQPAFFPFMIIHYTQMYINMEENICHYFDFIATLKKKGDSLSSRLTVYIGVGQ